MSNEIVQNNDGAQRLRIAIQKSGRLTEDTELLLKNCGIDIKGNKNHLLTHCVNMPVDIMRVRDDDIPGLVMNGVVDWGIVGQNVLEEAAMMRDIDGEPNDYKIVKKLNFGECRLALAIPQEQEWQGIQSLEGKKIATSYPYLLRRVMKEKGINVQCVLLAGSVEVAPRAGLADAICDLVCTGATLQSNGLKEVETIYESQAVIISPAQCNNSAINELAQIILTRLSGVESAKESKYIMMNAPRNKLKEITALLPGAENPSIIELEGDKERVALHVVSREKIFWETLEKLKALGASSILVVPIEKILD